MREGVKTLLIAVEQAALKVNMRPHRPVVAHLNRNAAAVKMQATGKIGIQHIGAVQAAAAGIVGYGRRGCQFEGTDKGCFRHLHQR